MRLLLALVPVGLLAWCAIVNLAGWWPVAALAYLYLVAVAAIWRAGGPVAAVRLLMGPRQ
jgi:hypothetical protein